MLGPAALRALLAALLVLAAPDARAQARPPAGYLADPAQFARAMETLKSAIGTDPPVMSLRVEPKRITVQVRGPRHAAAMDEWTVSRVDLYVLGRDVVRGPRGMSAPTHVRDASGGYFRLSEVDLAALPKLLEGTLARADLEDPAAVTQAVIERGWRLFPEPAWADLRWTVSVASRYERATITADPAGRITGADLSETNRARNLDLLSRDDGASLAEAHRALMAAIGRGAVVRRFEIEPDSVSVVAQLPGATPGLDDLSWTPSGLRKAPLPAFAEFTRRVRHENRDAAFSLADLDVAALPKVKEAARGLVQRPDARITEIAARKTAFSGELRWILTFDGGSSGAMAIETNLAGEVRDLRVLDNGLGSVPRL